jgi:hypothetical protein
MTLDLRSLGKLAFDVHISQDNKSLSAVEDVFYLLSDRRPCLVRACGTWTWLDVGAAPLHDVTGLMQVSEPVFLANTA